MYRFIKTATVVVVFFICMSLSISNISALMVEMSTTELVQGADKIIVGEVKDMQTRGGPNIGIKTFVSVGVEEAIKGGPIDKVLVELIGGFLEKEGIGLRASDAPVFEKDQEVLLFLKEKAKGLYYVHGAFQGKLTINKDGIIIENNKSLDKFVGEIQSILDQYNY